MFLSTNQYCSIKQSIYLYLYISIQLVCQSSILSILLPICNIYTSICPHCIIPPIHHIITTYPIEHRKIRKMGYLLSKKHESLAFFVAVVRIIFKNMLQVKIALRCDPVPNFTKCWGHESCPPTRCLCAHTGPHVCPCACVRA